MKTQDFSPSTLMFTLNRRSRKTLRTSRAQVFGAGNAPASNEDLAEYYRRRKIGCVVSPSTSGSLAAQVPNDEVAELAAKHSDFRSRSPAWIRPAARKQ